MPELDQRDRDDHADRQRRPRLSYANVVATLALFLALGGVSFAAATITGRDVVNNSLTGKDIRESRLGKVPKARNAERLGRHSPGFFLVRCPSNPPTIPIAGGCMETQARPAAPYSTAVNECGSTGRPSTPGRMLPTHGQLMVALSDQRIALGQPGELIDDTEDPSTPGGRFDVRTVTDRTGNTARVPDSDAGKRPYRCFALPLNGLQ